MSNQNYLPPISSILAATHEVGSFSGHYSPSNSTSSTYSYSSVSPQSTMNVQNKLNSNNPISQHISSNNNIRTLMMSPPESPEMKSPASNNYFNSYHGTHGTHQRYVTVPPPPPPPQSTSQRQSYDEPCSCCINKPTPIYSTAPVYSSQYSSQLQSHRYSYSIPYERKPTAPSLPRLNTILESLAPTKHFAVKNLTGQLSPTGSSSGNRYQCPYCSKRFSRPSSLRIHTYSHTGEKPFVCTEPGCGRKFSVQSNMRRHLRVHRLGRPVKKTRYDGEVDGYKMLSPAGILRSY